MAFYRYRRDPRPGSRAGEARSLGAVLWDVRDWPPMRPSGPEPGSDDGPIWPAAFSGITDLSANEKKAVTIVAVGLGAWLLMRHRRGARRRGRR